MADRERGRRLGGRRQPLVAALVLALAAAIVAVVVLVRRSPAPADASAGQQATGSATVRRRNLVATDTEAGTVSYSGAQTVYNRLGGTLTWLPNVGQVIHPGGTLFRVDGAPVILMKGSTPAYRDLGPSDSAGADILELNRNLIALGFDASAIVADDVWQDATTVGVELLQESEGESETGTLTLGKVVFLPGPQLVSTVDATLGDGGGGGGSTPATFTAAAPSPQFVSLTHARSSAATATTSSTPAASSTPSTSSPTTSTPASGPSGTTPSGTTPSGTTPSGTGTSPTGPPGAQPPGDQSLSALMELLRSETEQLRAEAQQLRAEAQALQRAGHGSPSGGSPSGSGSPKSSGSPSAGGSPSSSGSPSGGNGGGNGGGAGGNGGGNGGGGGGAGTAVLQTTSTHLIVTVDLAASSQSEARVGERVAVQMPAGNTIAGRVTAVSPVAQSSDNGSGNGNGGPGTGGGNGSGTGSSSTIPVTISLLGHHRGAGLDQAAVSVSFAQARARHVLSVPVTALIATTGGRYDVQEAAPPHRLIPVTTGLFAAGYVQISGPGLQPGLQVTDSQG